MDPTATPRRPRIEVTLESVGFDKMNRQNSMSGVGEINYLQPQPNCSNRWTQCCTGWSYHCGEGRWQPQGRGEPTERQRRHEQTC